MFLNDWIGLLSDTYLFLAMCATLNFKHFYFNSFGNALNSTLAVFIELIILTWPFFFGIFYKSFHKLDFKKRPKFIAKYGSAIDGLNFKRQGNLVNLYQCTNIVRKLILIATVVYLQDYPNFSIFSINFSTLLMIVMTGYTSPFTS